MLDPRAWPAKVESADPGLRMSDECMVPPTDRSLGIMLETEMPAREDRPVGRRMMFSGGFGPMGDD